MVTYSCDQLAAQLPNDLKARIDERVFVASPGEYQRDIYPDVLVTERPFAGASTQIQESDVAVAEPLVVELASEPMREGYIEIREAGSGNKLVTVIEFVSASNKDKGEGRKQYLRKQKECLATRVNLVEIDLLRDGRRVMALPDYRFPHKARTPYRICVTRARTRRCELYPAPLRSPLPAIRIPLRKTDRDVVLRIQPLIDACYRNGVYDDINYWDDPDPPLKAEDAARMNELLKGKGLR